MSSNYLKYFTFLTKEEIDTLDKEVQAHPENRTAQKRLAEEVTRFVHGEAGLAQALKVTAALFSGDIAELTGEEIEGAFRNTKGGEVAFAPVNIVDALVEAGVEKSNARQEKISPTALSRKRYADQRYGSIHLRPPEYERPLHHHPQR